MQTAIELSNYFLVAVACFTTGAFTAAALIFKKESK